MSWHGLCLHSSRCRLITGTFIVRATAPSGHRPTFMVAVGWGDPVQEPGRLLCEAARRLSPEIRAAQSYARRSRTAARISATTSAFGLAPRLPLPWTRTLTALAAMSRGPTTSMVWTLANSACWILPLILSLL
jgi:hypothetical protein